MTTELPDRWLTEEEKRTLRAAIDVYAWKHSWHLPKDRNGYTNWDSSETLTKCREVLQKYRRDAVRFVALCDKLDERIESIESAIAKFDAECEAVDAVRHETTEDRMKVAIGLFVAFHEADHESTPAAQLQTMYDAAIAAAQRSKQAVDAEVDTTAGEPVE